MADKHFRIHGIGVPASRTSAAERPAPIGGLQGVSQHCACRTCFSCMGDIVRRGNRGFSFSRDIRSQPLFTEGVLTCGISADCQGYHGKDSEAGRQCRDGGHARHDQRPTRVAEFTAQFGGAHRLPHALLGR